MQNDEELEALLVNGKPDENILKTIAEALERKKHNA